MSLNIDLNTITDPYMREHIIKIQNAINAIPAATAPVPTGTAALFSTTTVPSGYILTNGAALKQSDYPTLYAAIGTTYGDGSKNADGKSSGFTPGTAFNVPTDSHFSFPTGKGMIKT